MSVLTKIVADGQRAAKIVDRREVEVAAYTVAYNGLIIFASCVFDVETGNSMEFNTAMEIKGADSTHALMYGMERVFRMVTAPSEMKVHVFSVALAQILSIGTDDPQYKQWYNSMIEQQVASNHLIPNILVRDIKEIDGEKPDAAHLNHVVRMADQLASLYLF